MGACDDTEESSGFGWEIGVGIVISVLASTLSNLGVNVSVTAAVCRCASCVLQMFSGPRWQSFLRLCVCGLCVCACVCVCVSRTHCHMNARTHVDFSLFHSSQVQKFSFLREGKKVRQAFRWVLFLFRVVACDGCLGVWKCRALKTAGRT